MIWNDYIYIYILFFLKTFRLLPKEHYQVLFGSEDNLEHFLTEENASYLIIISSISSNGKIFLRNSAKWIKLWNLKWRIKNGTGPSSVLLHFISSGRTLKCPGLENAVNSFG